ncbi:MAG: dihydroneopterin aldolase [Pseudomonadota bacterium]
MQIPPLSDGHYAVFLEDLRVHVRLGVLPHEVRPQAFACTVAMICTRIGYGDGIEDVVDYNNLRDAVLELTNDQHFGLQETLCEAIIERLKKHPYVHGVMVETRKLTVYDDAAAVGCAMASIDASALR